MTAGPVEYLLIEFPGSQFRGEIVPELARLVETGLISIIDLVFVTKDEDGTIVSLELDQLGDPTIVSAFEDVEGSYGGLIGEADLAEAAAAMAPGSSAGLLVFENLWAAPFAAAVAAAGGVLVANQRIPADLVDDALASTEVAEGERA